MTLKLIKIEEGVCRGNVVHHEFIKKTPAEIKGLEYTTICLLNLNDSLIYLSDELAQNDQLSYFHFFVTV